MDTILEMNHISKTYMYQNSKQTVLKNISISIEKKDMLAIMGKSGSGKSTLLMIMGTILKPSSGSLKVMGKDISGLCPNEISRMRRENIGFVFQEFRLLDNLNVGENILLPRILDRKYSKEMKNEVNRISKMLEIENIIDKDIMEISGGERQRVAIARALINNPDIILADEPTGNLDSQSSKVVLQLLCKINEEMNKTIVIVTHDLEIAGQCKKILKLKDGEIINV